MSTSPNEPSKLGGNDRSSTDHERGQRPPRSPRIQRELPDRAVHAVADDQLRAAGLNRRPGGLDAGPRHRQLLQDLPRLPRRTRPRATSPATTSSTTSQLYRLIGTGVSAARSYWESDEPNPPPPARPPRRTPRSRSAPSRARSSRPRAAGSRSVYPTLMYDNKPAKGGTSPPGKSRSCSRSRSGRRSGHSGSRQEAARSWRAVRRRFTRRAEWSKPRTITPPWAP